MKKGRLTTIILIPALLIGLSLLLYPTLSDYWNSLHQTHVIESYSRTISEASSDEVEKILEDAQEYNANILNRASQYKMSDEELEEYESTLSLDEDGVMGYVEIPAIDCSLPIYHGTDEDVLNTSIGHLQWTSLPVGGESTHTVLSGHRGLPSAKLFSNLDKLKIGDVFMLNVLNETLTYEVDQILIVEPKTVGSLRVVEGQDYCTLVTCTPYGVNTHRLLVRGHRVDNSTNYVNVTADAVQIDRFLIASIIAAIILIPLVLIIIFGGRKNRRKKRGKKTKNLELGGKENEQSD